MRQASLEQIREQTRTPLLITSVRHEETGLLVKGDDMLAVSTRDLPQLRELVARLSDSEVPRHERDGGARLHGTDMIHQRAHRREAG